MTPEERFTKIENSIQALAENQARHDLMVEKQNAGIRDLIVVSRTLVDTQKHADERLHRLIDAVREVNDAQKHTDEALKSLIRTVDRIVRHGGNGSPN